MMRKTILTVSILCTFFCFLELLAKENVHDLHQKAERAILEKDFSKARSSYEKLLDNVHASNKSSKEAPIEWATYVDVILRLSHLYQNDQELEKGELLLNALSSQNPPPEFQAQVNLVLARLKCTQNKPQKAFALLQATSKLLPIEKWRAEDRSFYLGLFSMLDAHFESVLKQAEVYFFAKVYDQAIPLYEKALRGIEKNAYPSCSVPLEKQIRYRLAEGYFAKAQYEKSLSLIEELGNHDNPGGVEREALYLCALVYQERKELEKAVDAYQAYLTGKDKKDLPHFLDALLEVGLLSFQEQKWEKAKKYLQLCIENCSQENQRPAYLATLYLGRISLKQKQYHEANDLLHNLSQALPKGHPLLYEVGYLQGTAFFQMGIYSEACEHFEKALPTKHLSQESYHFPWAPQVLYQLGWSYLKLGDDPFKNKSDKKIFFEKAESLFRTLEESDLKENALLALGKLFLLNYKYFNNEEEKEKLALTLLPQWVSFSLEGQLEALFLLAEGSENYEEKENYYCLATAREYKKCSSYPNSWYYRGLNHFQEGMQVKKNAEAFFEKATLAFEKAFLLFDKIDKYKAATLLKLEAESDYYRGSAYSLVCSLATLEKLFHQYSKLYLPLGDQAHTLYLRGLVASKLSIIEKKEEYLPIAEESLQGVIYLAEDKESRSAALSVLATLYSQKEMWDNAYTYFQELAQNYPQTSHAAKAWFWIAEIGTKLNKPKDEIQSARQKVYTYYPNSSYAEEAYFYLYSLEEYQTGTSESIKHLEQFPIKYPHSPLNIAAHYLLGLDHKRKKNGAYAKDAFAKSIGAYEMGSLKAQNSFFDFRIRALLETGRLLLSEGKEQGNDLLCYLVEELDQKVKSEKEYLPIYQECGVTLVRGLITHQNLRLASIALAQILQNFHLAGMQEGYYLAESWELGAKIAILKKEYQSALDCLNMAEVCGTRHLPSEDMLKIWMGQALCHQEFGKYSQAMRTLSKVINENVASPLRMEAMYKRAEIYQLQGRDELAVRQLEAVAKKGGDWGNKAKETLRSQYGMHTSRSWIHYE